MHRIQKFILAQLMEQPALRYSDMRPPSMEASQFMYHLKKLQSSGLVVKTETGQYSLSAKGRQFVDRADADEIVLRDQPRVAALMVCSNQAGEVLLMRRATQPFVGWVGFPLVDVPIDYPLPLLLHVQTSFAAMTGLQGTYEHRADGYIKLLRDGELEGNLLAHVITLQTEHGHQLAATDGNEYFWGDPDQTTRILPSTMHVIKQLNSQKSFFFFEYEHTIKEHA